MSEGVVERLLKPAVEVDVEAALAAYAAGVPQGRTGRFVDFVKAAVDRSMEVLYPFLLQAARDARGKTVCLDGGWSYGFEDTGNPWRPSLLVQNPDGIGYLCAFRLDVRPTREALAAFEPGLVSEMGEGFSIKGTMARLDAERRLVDCGFVTGMPDPDTVTGIKEAGIHLVATSGGRIGEPVGLFHDTLEETLASVASGSYSGGRLIVFKPDGDHLKIGSECLLVSGALDALALLGRVALDAAGHEVLSARNHEVASRGVTTLCDRAWETALPEAAGGTVFRDGGFPGRTTRDAASRAWLHDVARSMPRMVEELAEARGILQARDHASRDGAYECNDGRSLMWVEDGPDGASDAYLASQDGLYIVRQVEDGEGTAVALARLGGCDRGDHLLPADTALAQGGAGFLGRFRVGGDGSAAVVQAPVLDDHAILGIGSAVITVSSVAACAGEEYGPVSPAP